MRTLTAFATALAVSLSIVACGASAQDDSSADDNSDQGDEQDITAAKAQLKGSWTIDDSSSELSSTVAYDFRPNGEFFRDSNRVLNGVLVAGAPQPVQRETGRYTVNARKHTLTLHVTSPTTYDETLSYVYTAGRILNGVFLPGKEPPAENATLTLTGIAAPGSHVAFPSIKYDHAASWCTSTADCDEERADGTWLGGMMVGGPSLCDTSKRVCTIGFAKDDPNN